VTEFVSGKEHCPSMEEIKKMGLDGLLDLRFTGLEERQLWYEAILKLGMPNIIADLGVSSMRADEK
jgi:hypothetical protein